MDLENELFIWMVLMLYIVRGLMIVDVFNDYYHFANSPRQLQAWRFNSVISIKLMVKNDIYIKYDGR